MTDPVLPGSPALDKAPPWWELGICYLIIAWSVAFVLMPSLRGVRFTNFAAGALFVGWCARRFIRDKRAGLLGKSPARLYAAAKAGRLRADPLEAATVAAYGLATVLQMHAVWP